MPIAVITGSGGLVGSESARFFAELGFDVIGIDNDLRRVFFGDEASTAASVSDLTRTYPGRYVHLDCDIRDRHAIEAIFRKAGPDIEVVVHTAAQPSHDWAARDPHADFSVNAVGTLNLLEATRAFSPDAVFIFTSTNKVYGDRPNALPLQELATRWEIDPSHPFNEGIDESMSIDATLHSLFGSSKVAADVMVQEYGRYFEMKTGVFRGGCLTGPRHAGTMLHGFLAYLMKCVVTETPYTVFGYGGKQVRDNIHSKDLVSAFFSFYREPRPGEVYNIGGGRFSHCSMLEAISLCEAIAGKKLGWTYVDQNRRGDHVWYVSDTAKFREHFPSWKQQYDVRGILQDIYDQNVVRWSSESAVR